MTLNEQNEKKKTTSTQLKVIVTREAMHCTQTKRYKTKQKNEFNAMEMIANIYNRYYILIAATKRFVRTRVS